MALFLFIFTLLYILFILFCIAGILFSRDQKKSTYESQNFTLVIPFRNEEKNIGDILKYFSSGKKFKKIILADDHSEDSSPAIAQEYAKVFPEYFVYLKVEGKGKKSAI